MVHEQPHLYFGIGPETAMQKEEETAVEGVFQLVSLQQKPVLHLNYCLDSLRQWLRKLVHFVEDTFPPGLS